MILSALTESFIRNLLWACLVDNKIEPARANEIADGRLNRSAMIDLIKSLSALPVRDLAFPTRNLVAHGIWFDKGKDPSARVRSEDSYKDELKDQASRIRSWVQSICGHMAPSNYMPSEVGRWILFMYHWSKWLVDTISAL